MRADSIIASLGFPNSHPIEAIGFSGGKWLCWFDTVKVTVLASQFQFIHCRVTSVDSSDSLLATFVYASPNRRLRYQLWHYIEQLVISITDPWVILGDFNATLTAADRRGCSSNSPKQSFSDMVFNCGLMDLGFPGPTFTWYSGSRAMWLDCCFDNTAWFSSFPNFILHHLVRMKSDHRPLLLQTATNSSSPRAKHLSISRSGTYILTSNILLAHPGSLIYQFPRQYKLSLRQLLIGTLMSLVQ
ncbi:hypothetical protein V6N13_097505 [Hibiscus sabdariffa]